MKANPKPQLRIFQTLGVSLTILPYISKNYDEWGNLMWNICYPARLAWHKYEMAFLNRHIEWEYNFDEELSILLKSSQIDPNPKLNERYELTLDAEDDPDLIQDFLVAVRPLRFTFLNKLTLNAFESLDEEGTKNAAIFLKLSIPSSIGTFSFHAEDSDIKSYSKSLSILLLRVQRKVEISNFVLSQKDVKMILEKSRNSEEIVFHNCTFGKISDDFSLRPDLKYKTKILAVTASSYHQNIDRSKLQRLAYIGEALTKASSGTAPRTFYSLAEYEKHASAALAILAEKKSAVQQGAKA